MKNKIREIRKAKGLSYEELSEKSGVSVERICYIEDDKYTPSLDMALRICRQLGCDVSEVFTEKSSHKSIKNPLVIYAFFQIMMFSIDSLFLERQILHLKIVLLLIAPITLFVKPIYNYLQKQVDNEVNLINRESFLKAVSAFLFSFVFVYIRFDIDVRFLWEFLYFSSGYLVYFYMINGKT